eukprot:scaffold5198_cov176-Ochromonas_danica.AAC.2
MRRSLSSFQAQLLSYERITTSSTSTSAHPKHSIAFLHGILGNKRNWQTPAKAFLKALPDFSATTLDLVGHGASYAGVDSPPTLRHSALEVRRLFTQKSFLEDLGFVTSHHGHHHPHDSHDHHRHHQAKAEVVVGGGHAFPTVLVGHSFGGKVALKYLKHCVSMGYPLPAVTFILDSLPGVFQKESDATHTQSVTHILNILQQAPETFSSKNEALDYLSSKGIDSAIVHWLAMNLVPVQGSDTNVRFSFDISYIQKLFEDYCATDMWEFLYDFNRASQGREANESFHVHHQNKPHVHAHGHADSAVGHPHGKSKIVFVRAGKNKSWTEPVLSKFRELEEGVHVAKEVAHPHAGHHNHTVGHHPHAHGNVSLVTMPHVGHWLHVEDMQGLVNILVDHTKQALHH